MKHSLLRWLLPLLLLNLTGAAWAATPPGTGPAAATPSLAAALNPDGTLKAGATGSFDARAFRMRTAPDGRPVFRSMGTTGAGDERWQGGLGAPNGTDDLVRVVVRAGNDVYIGGRFTVVENVAANSVAKWNGTAWSALGTGVTNALLGDGIYSLAVAANGEVYAGGRFAQAGGVAANNVAKWNGTAWNPLGTGVASPGDIPTVYALALAGNGNLYAGGGFTQVGGIAANGVAQWNGTAWSPLGAGVGLISSPIAGEVYALAVAPNGDLYVGGLFLQAGGLATNGLAKWNGTAWSRLGTGLNGSSTPKVYALAVAGNGDVYVGGEFIQAGSVAAYNIARWNGTAWNALSTGVANPFNFPLVRALAVAGNGDVYAGGEFSQAGGVAAANVAKWNGTSWSPLGTGVANGVNDAGINALAVAGNGDVYTGGIFLQAGGTLTSGIARWNGTAWVLFGIGGASGVGGMVYAVAVVGNGDVYVGGGFSQAGGVAANNIARWNGTGWSPLGAGTANSGLETATVRALAVAGNGDLYVGGRFTYAGGVTVNNVARWNGTVWNALGTGVAGISSGSGRRLSVLALTVANSGDVYAGGNFIQAGGITVNGVARWNGTAWNPLGAGLTFTGSAITGEARALALASNGDLYVGGGFTRAGGAAINQVAKWNGTAWSPLGTGITNGLNGSVYAVAVAGNGDVYVGGYFTQAGGIAATNVAWWNGTAWSPLGASTSSSANLYIYALALAGNGDVYAGGYFTQVGGVVVNSVAKWNGTTWGALGTGTSGSVTALALGATGKLYAGGGFTTTGDGSKAMARFGVYDPNAPLATTAAVRAAPAALFPNPAHGAATLRLPAGAPRLPLTLADALGRVVRRYPAPATAEADLDLRGLPAGAYVLRCGELSQRLVVE